MPPSCDRELSQRLGRFRPLDVARAWPSDQPLIMLHSGRPHARWARWSILAGPSAVYRFEHGGGSRWVEGSAPGPRLDAVQFRHDPLADLDAIIRATACPDREQQAREGAPFRGGWIGCFSYDLGRAIEPRAQHHPSDRCTTDWPLIELAWCPNALIYDNIEHTWHVAGHPSTPIQDPESRIQDPESLDYRLSRLRAAIDADRYTSAVGRTLEYIAAGDIFQANIAQQFTAELTGSARALALAALQHAQPWYGAYLELPPPRPIHIPKSTVHHRVLLSLSPELFLQLDPLARLVTTRPIKGTRPASIDPATLLNSSKDAAELHMIVDLMRNDLGRVCEFGSVEVVESRRIETHPTVHQGVAEVIGRVRPNVTFGDLLRATFPSGSVTGAPKIRAMQIIDELESSPRGPYCGAVGYVSNCGRACLNVAIRTALLTPARGSIASESLLSYSAGAGIVADSNPVAEYRECLDKTAIIRGLANGHAPLHAHAGAEAAICR